MYIYIYIYISHNDDSYVIDVYDLSKIFCQVQLLEVLYVSENPYNNIRIKEVWMGKMFHDAFRINKCVIIQMNYWRDSSSTNQFR